MEAVLPKEEGLKRRSAEFMSSIVDYQQTDSCRNKEKSDCSVRYFAAQILAQFQGGFIIFNKLISLRDLKQQNRLDCYPEITACRKGVGVTVQSLFFPLTAFIRLFYEWGHYGFSSRTVQIISPFKRLLPERHTELHCGHSENRFCTEQSRRRFSGSNPATSRVATCQLTHQTCRLHHKVTD